MKSDIKEATSTTECLPCSPDEMVMQRFIKAKISTYLKKYNAIEKKSKTKKQSKEKKQNEEEKDKQALFQARILNLFRNGTNIVVEGPCVLIRQADGDHVWYDVKDKLTLNRQRADLAWSFAPDASSVYADNMLAICEVKASTLTAAHQGMPCKATAT